MQVFLRDKEELSYPILTCATGFKNVGDKTILGVIIKLSSETVQITLTRFNAINLKICLNGMLKKSKNEAHKQSKTTFDSLSKKI